MKLSKIHAAAAYSASALLIGTALFVSRKDNPERQPPPSEGFYETFKPASSCAGEKNGRVGVLLRGDRASTMTLFLEGDVEGKVEVKEDSGHYTVLKNGKPTDVVGMIVDTDLSSLFGKQSKDEVRRQQNLHLEKDDRQMKKYCSGEYTPPKLSEPPKLPENVI